MSDERWYFSKEKLENSPSRRLGIDADQELNYKQLAANLIYDMGSRKCLSVNQLCISTAIVYMHRFYVFHSFTHFQWHTIAMASLFLAAKVEEQTRKLEHVIKTAQWCLTKSQANVNFTSESYADQVQELVMNENILLQTLGFDVNVKHPHTFVVEFCEKIKLNKDITKTMYGMASNSLNVTTMCVQYKPSVVACFCIHFICKWSNHQIKMKDESRPWWSYIDASVTQELLEQMISEFLQAYEKSPSRLKCKIQELLKCRNLSSHHTDHKLDASGQSSSDSFCHSSSSASTSSASSSSASFTSTLASASMFQHSETPPVGIHHPQASVRMHRPSTNYISNHHPSSQPATNAPSWSAIINGGINTFVNTQMPPSHHIRSNPAPHVSSSQQQQQQQQQQHQHRYSQHQQNYQHRHHASQMPSNAKHPHKPTNVPHDVPRPKIEPMGHSTTTSGSNVMPTKHPMKPDPRMANEIAKKSGLAVKHEPDHHYKPIPKLPCATAGSDSHKKVHYSSGLVTSNIIRGVSLANPIDQRTEVKTEPSDAAADTVDSSTYFVRIPKPSRSHSIFSPSPIRNESAYSFELPIKEEVPLVEERIIQEPLPGDVQIKRESLPGDVQIKRESLSGDVQIKQEASVTIPSSQQVHQDMQKVENVGDYENIFRRNLTNEQPVCTPVITNVVTLASLSNAESIQREPSKVKSEPSDYSELSSTDKLPLPPQSAEKNAILDNRIDIIFGGECSSRKMKKDKHHKEKKRHKDDRHRHHHKEHKSKEKQHRRPEPIKITIPKERLADIPASLKLKINADRIVTPSTSSKDVRLINSSQNASKSHKRKRESDGELPRNPHNGFKDCL